MGNNIFRRVEKKYLLTKEDRDKLFDRIWIYLEKDKFYESTVSNIYFDTVNNDLIINSIDKPVFKEKVRLRTYKTPITMDSEVFLEIKRKFKGIVGKRRVCLSLKEFYDFYPNGNLFLNAKRAAASPVIIISSAIISLLSKRLEGSILTFFVSLSTIISTSGI